MKALTEYNFDQRFEKIMQPLVIAAVKLLDLLSGTTKTQWCNLHIHEYSNITTY